RSCDQFAQLMTAHPGVKSIVDHFETNADSCLISLHRASDRRQLLQVFAETGMDLEQFSIVEPTLEEIFIEKVGDVI
ncbi:MAG: DUF4162 domain-containing protein, partial [Bacillota bacterium]|nr:DUF4162 domain-containing protein [Bacillota bacterium]